MSKVVLICGVGGQDGSYLAQLLLHKGYKVWGTSRDALGGSFNNLRRLNVFADVERLTMSVEDFRSVFKAITTSKPDEIYYLAGQSSVGLSFEEPAETIQSINLGILNILEVCRLIDRDIKVYNAGSSECFGDTDGRLANEATPFHPVSPYAVAKSSATWLVNSYRSSYDIHACTGILFNHESSLRPARFVTQKIVQSARRIADGSKERLTLGRLDISRDWGWAPEYVEAMWKMLQEPIPENYIIATGSTHTLEEFVSESFALVGLGWRDYVDQDVNLFRPSDIQSSLADTSKAKEKLSWCAKYTMKDVISKMMSQEL